MCNNYRYGCLGARVTSWPNATIALERRRRAYFFALALIAFVAGGCIDLATRGRDVVTVLAPIDVEGALETALDTFQAAVSDVRHRGVYAGGAEHASRVASDEAAAIVITGHSSLADFIAEKRAVIERLTIAGDDLVIVANSGSQLAQNTDPGVLMRAAVTSVAIPDTAAEPAGMYAREALLRFGIWSRLEPRVLAVTSVSKALEALQTGEAQAAIVLGSALENAQLDRLTIDPSYHQPIRFEILLLDNTEIAAGELFRFISGPQGQSVFQAAGFAPPPS